MKEIYIAPREALKKLRAARRLGQTVYIYGATGYGKTELVKRYLANRRYHHFSCGEGTAGLGNVQEREWKELAGEAGGKEHKAVVLVDDLHMLKNKEGRKIVLEWSKKQEVWLILVSRSPVPSWLMPLYVKEGFLIISEEDLNLKEEEITDYLTAEQIPFTGEEAAYIREKSQGNAYVIRHTILRMKEGLHPGDELTEEIESAFADYLENFILMQWDTDLLEFLMQISVVEEFTLPLAEMVTGNCRVSELLEKAEEAGNFLFCTNGVYRY